MWKSRQTQQLGFWGRIGLLCDPNPPRSLPEQLSEPPQRATAVGDLSLNPRQEACSTPWSWALLSSPPMPQTLQTVTIAWRGLLRGLKPPTAAAWLVNGSMQADHLRAPGVHLWRAAHVSCCFIHRGSQRERALRTPETEQKTENKKTRNFQGDLFFFWTQFWGTEVL